MRKKILSIILAILIIIPMSYILSACGHKHTHTYSNDNKYVVIDSKAYTTAICECGDIKYTELENYIIATPQNAQFILDGGYGKLSGKTVVFFKGVYGAMKVRSTIDTLSNIYEYNVSDPLDMRTTTTIDALSNTSCYHYTRDLENVNFVAVDGAIFTGVFSIQSKDYETHIWQGDDVTGISEERSVEVDPIRHIKVRDNNSNGIIETGDTAFVDHIRVKNVKFENMNFTGKNGRIFVYHRYAEDFKNVTFSNCSFVTDEEWTGYSAIHLMSPENDYNITRENITVENCNIVGHFQGIALHNVENAVIKNNNISKTTHNSINLQGTYSKGDILIERNNLSEAGDRAIRFYYLIEANVLLKNNALTNASDSDGEIVKTQVSDAGSSITTIDNTFNGSAIPNNTYSTTSTPQIIISVSINN